MELYLAPKNKFHKVICFLFLFIFLCIQVNIAQNDWTWIKGQNTIAAKGIYGTLGVSNASNTPGSRYGSLSWTDLSGNLWLYGGYGKDTGYVSAGAMADLWKFDIFLGQWVWVSGSNINYQGTNPVYGTMGVASSTNNPGYRSGSATWVDAVGNLWLFGGAAFDLTGTGGCAKNDMWKYNISSNMWTWMGGSSTCYPYANYGTKGVSTSSNVPGGRHGMSYWKDANGNLWIFGGNGVINSITTGEMNDLWKYDMTTNQWVWMSGSSSFSQSGSYGTLGVASSTIIPGSRNSVSTWTDKFGILWLFGGVGYDALGSYGGLNDLWKYNPTSNQWTWMRGSHLRNQLPVYGSMNVFSSTSQPGAMDDNAAWVDSTGNNLYLGIGGSINHVNSGFFTNIMWKYNIPSNQWTWVKGPNILADQPGIYGTQGVPANSNIPGGRNSSCSWKGNNGEFWLFGGFGFANSPNYSQMLNDLWKFNPCYTAMTLSNTTSSTSSTICANMTTTLNASSTGTISWYDLNYNLLATGNNFSVPILTTSTTFILEDNVSCLPTSITVTVIPSPTLNITASNTLLCAGATATLTGFTNAAFSSWSNGGTNYFTTVTPSVTTTYSVLVTAFPTGCTNSGVKTVSVVPSPTVSITASNTLVCQGFSVSLSALSSGVSYSWSSGGSTSITAVTPSSSTTYTVKVTNGNGCSTNASKSIIVNPLPVVAAIASSTSTCIGGTVVLTGTGADFYIWNNGVTNGLAFSPSITSSYLVIGTNTLTGCQSTNTAAQTIVVNSLPTLSVNVSTTSVCSGGTVMLSGMNANTYVWSHGINNGVSFIPSQTTTYSLTGTNTLTGCSNTITQAISVLSIPGVTISPSATVICAGSQVILNGLGSNNYVFSGGVLNGVPFFPTVTATYSATVTDAVNGCINSGIQNIVVNPLPVLSVNASTTGVCPGGTVMLSGANADTYLWSHGISNGVSFTPLQTNTYTLTGTNTLTGCSDTLTQAILVFSIPGVTISPSATVVCAGAQVILNGLGPNNYIFSGGVLNGVPFFPTVTTVYTATVTDLVHGCQNSDIQNIVVNPLPVIISSATSNTVCEGEFITLLASGADTYTWTGATNGQAFPVTITQTYSVQGTNTLTGCTSTNNASQTILVNALPNLTITGQTICVGETATLKVSGAQNYTWSTNEQTMSIIVSPPITTTYNVMGIDSNGCKNSTSYVQMVDECTGISNMDENNNLINIYPNPNNGSFTIFGISDIDLVITNEIGSLIRVIRIRENRNQVDLMNELIKGIYFISGQKDGLWFKAKIIVAE